MWRLTSFSEAQPLHINSSSAMPRAAIRFLWTVVRSDLGTLHKHTRKTHSTQYVCEALAAAVIRLKKKFHRDVHTLESSAFFPLRLLMGIQQGYMKCFSPLMLYRVYSVTFVTHPTEMKRMKVKRRPHRDTPQPMNVSTCRAFSFSGLL